MHRQPKVAEEKATPSTSLRDLISQDDYQYQKIPQMTISELWTRMQNGCEYYNLVPVDSVIREIHFASISYAYDIPYDTVYYTRQGKPEKAKEAMEIYNNPVITIS